jgi:uncharacterized membrane protein YuzA (DUF378 family)
MSGLYKACLALTIIGALNWLLVGAFHWNLVSAIFGEMSMLSRLIYIVVGLAGLVCLGIFARDLNPARNYGRELQEDRETNREIRRVA